MLLTETCYYLENQVFGGVNNWDIIAREIGTQVQGKERGIYFQVNSLYYLHIDAF